MRLTLILITIFIVIIIITGILVFSTTCDRNYWKRVLPIQKCAFGNRKYEVIDKINPYQTYDGIIAYSLYGNYEKYSVKLIKNCSIIPNKLKGWHARIYTAKDIPKNIVKQITKNGGEIFVMGPELPLSHEGSLWRFHAAKENVPVVCLDADDDFNQEIQIKQWLKSGHIFANFSRHGYFVPLAAGLWGHNPKSKNHLENIDQDINQYCEHWFGIDECFLKYHVWPKFKKYGYYQTQTFLFKELTIIGIIIFFILMIYLLKETYKLENEQKINR